MNLTITQAIERTRDLSGELKAARTAKADCAADVEAKDRMAEIARKALTNAEDHEARLIAERDELADHIAALVRKTGEAIELDDKPAIDRGRFVSGDSIAGFGLADTADDQAARLMEHAESRVNGALERATQ